MPNIATNLCQLVQKPKTQMIDNSTHNNEKQKTVVVSALSTLVRPRGTILLKRKQKNK